MTKPREILKGKVKRLLREQEDMGMLCDPAVQHCVSALEAFVHDLGRRLKAQAEATGAETITPIELKRTVLESQDLAFLHDKVQAIDESDAKYHKPTRKRKAPATQAASKKSKPSNTKSKVSAAEARALIESNAKATSVVSGPEVSKPAATLAAAIEEDDNYDSSDSE